MISYYDVLSKFMFAQVAGPEKIWFEDVRQLCAYFASGKQNLDATEDRVYPFSNDFFWNII